MDGGILETFEMNEKEILKELSEFANIDFSNKIEIDDNESDKIINKIQI